MDTKFSDSNYFTSDDESVFIPYTTAGDLWDARYASVMLFERRRAEFDGPMQQFRAAIANRQHFFAERQARHPMFGAKSSSHLRKESMGIEALLFFVGHSRWASAAVA